LVATPFLLDKSIHQISHFAPVAMQVQALVAAPFLLDDPQASKLFPKDALARAKQLLSKQFFPGGIGAYSDSRGAEGVRREIAAYIEKRDGVPSDPDVSAHCAGLPMLSQDCAESAWC
jgi:hypothetical protein